MTDLLGGARTYRGDSRRRLGLRLLRLGRQAGRQPTMPVTLSSWPSWSSLSPTVASKGSSRTTQWRSSTGAIVYADLLMGERREQASGAAGLGPARL